MFAVIIPSKNAANLIPCLWALRKHEPDCPVVVVDDGIGDQGVYAAAACDPIKFINGVKPFVFARNCNAGIHAANTFEAFRFHAPSGYVLLNDDALLESPGGFSLLAKCCAEDHTIGVIGATTNLTGQSLQNRQTGWYGLRIIPHIAFVCCYIPRRTIDLLAMMSGPAGRRWFSGGLLDERYCLGYGVEDCDYCEQVKRAGLKVAVHDGCFVDHSKLTSSFRGDPRSGGDFSQNYRLLMEKWGRLITQPGCMPPMSAEAEKIRAMNAEIMRKQGL